MCIIKKLTIKTKLSLSYHNVSNEFIKIKEFNLPSLDESFKPAPLLTTTSITDYVFIWWSLNSLFIHAAFREDVNFPYEDQINQTGFLNRLQNTFNKRLIGS